ncbi:MAG: 3-sulfinopropanoyl-CoA desulfinase [Pseudomonadota bacterium]
MTVLNLEMAKELSIGFAARAQLWDKTRSYCWPNVEELAKAGIMGMTIPTEYGGKGASLFETVMVVEEIAKACTLTARIVVEANMGGIGAVMAYGTPAQIAFCAEHVLAGDKPAICITEPDAGSAATEMRMTAKKCGDHFVLNGTKHWITGGGVSKIHLVFARVLDDAGKELGIGGFIVFADPAANERPEGFRVAGRENTLGLCGMPEAELHFENVRVHEKWLLQPPSGLSQGFSDLMAAYNSQRVGAGAVALGVAAGAFGHAKRYLVEREQFGRPLAEFQGLQWMLADMDTKVHAARSLLHAAAQSKGANGALFPDMTMAARSKLFASEIAIEVVNDALQMFGARGYSDREPLERMYRDVRMFTIGGGTAQILRTQIAGRVLGIKTPQTRAGEKALGQVSDLAAE